jgi:hypothetical protein
MADLEHMKLKQATAPEKVARDTTSYQVESAFLGSLACSRLCAAGARIAQPYHVVSRPSPAAIDPIHSKFSLLLEDFSPEDGWNQYGILSDKMLRSVLSALAEMHAFYWKFEREKDYASISGAVWEQGSYWVPERQASNLFDLIAPEWAKHRANFAAALDEAGVTGQGAVTLENLGTVLSKHALDIAERVHAPGGPNRARRTLIHGDIKAANAFFRASCNDGSKVEVGLIDFQWSGWGAGIVDVAYLLVSSADMDSLSADGTSEMKLVEFYRNQFAQSLVRFGKVNDLAAALQCLPWADLKRSYEDALLDLSRLVFAYHWSRIRASPDVLESRRSLLGSNSYNKSVPHAMWLIARTASLLDINYCN